MWPLIDKEWECCYFSHSHEPTAASFISVRPWVHLFSVLCSLHSSRSLSSFLSLFPFSLCSFSLLFCGSLFSLPYHNHLVSFLLFFFCFLPVCRFLSESQLRSFTVFGMLCCVSGRGKGKKRMGKGGRTGRELKRGWEGDVA